MPSESRMKVMAAAKTMRKLVDARQAKRKAEAEQNQSVPAAKIAPVEPDAILHIQPSPLGQKRDPLEKILDVLSS